MKSVRSIAILFVLLVPVPSWLFSQSSEGRILGTITDQSGAVVAGARITITNISTNVNRQLMSTGAGEYVAPNLEPGPYRVSAEAQGFTKTVSTQFALEVSRDVRIDFEASTGRGK